MWKIKADIMTPLNCYHNVTHPGSNSNNGSLQKASVFHTETKMGANFFKNT